MKGALVAVVAVCCISFVGCTGQILSVSGVTQVAATLDVRVTCDKGDKGESWIEHRRLGATSAWTQVGRTAFKCSAAATTTRAFQLTGLSAGTTYETRLCADLNGSRPALCTDTDGTVHAPSDDSRARSDITYFRFTTQGTPISSPGGPSTPISSPGGASTQISSPGGPSTPISSLGGPSCQPGATNVATAAAVRSEVQAGRNVCVTANVSNVNLTGLVGSDVRYVGTTGSGQMGAVDLSNSSRITLRARLRSTTLRSSNFITIEQSVIGGTPTSRVLDQLIFIPCCSDDVTVRDSDIGWTNADSSGNTGYAIRVHGGSGCCSDRLRIERNKIHDIAADAIQGLGTGADVLIDRNEIGPVGANPGSNEHSDNIQIIDNGPNLRITNNWIHHQGYYNGQVVGNAGATYIHGGSTNALLYENNLVEAARGRLEICGLGTGGTSRSNLTVRRNTFADGGQAFSGFPGFEWDCESGSGNRVERNIAVDPDGGFALNGSAGAAFFSSNLFGQPSLVTLDAAGNCTSGNCNPGGQEAIGYRKPAGVHW
jgi:hypothetical protein